MKIQTLSWGLLWAVLFCCTVAATRQDALDAAIGAIKNGNAAQLSERFDQKLTLTLPDQSAQLSKAQAQTAITKFFETNTVSGFELKHRGQAPAGAFAMGTLQTDRGQFRVNIFMSASGPKAGIRELRIQTMD